MKNKKRWGKGLVILVSALTIMGVSAQDVASKPNIIFIMADDLGPGWVDFAGDNPQIHTPNLVRMAQTGMVFTRAYAAASICSPTRAACITGLSPAAIKLTTHIPGAAGRRHPANGGPSDAKSINQLPLELPSYARELKKLGYATAFLGKWHLAGEGSIKTKDGIVDERYHPQHYGFDLNIGGCAYGQPKSWFDSYRNGTIEDRTKGQYLTDRLGDEAVKFITDHANKAFHLTLWPYSVHTPIQAPKDLVKANGGDRYLAMVESLDLAVGKVLDALAAQGIQDNTLLIFYSDNGGHKATEGLAEEKGSLMEGGLRVPMVVTWPQVIKGGTQSATPITSMDFFPTFLNAAGGTTAEVSGLDDGKEIEGLDLMPLFQGEPQLARKALYWHYPHNRKGITYAMGSQILAGDWKFYQGYGKTKDALFNLKEDPSEKQSVLTAHPEIAQDLRKQLGAWLTKVDAEMPVVK